MNPASPPSSSTSMRLALRAVAAVAVAACVGAVALASCGGGSSDAAGTSSRGLVVRSVTIDEPVNGKTAAVRMVLDNSDGTTDRLVSASSDAAETVTLHRSTTDDQDRSVMEPVSGVAVPAGKEVRFEAGGLHVMLSGFRHPLEVGDVVDLTLVFQHAGSMTVDAKVVPIGDNGMDDMSHDMSDMDR